LRRGGRVLSGGSGCGGQPGDVVPGTEAVGDLASVFLGVERVTAGPEVRGYPAERGQEPLRVPRLLSVVDFADDAFIGVVDDWGVRKPRPVVVGGALVGSVMGCSVW
jgi:hypothetical protein